MKSRELAATLKLLKQFDVASYTVGADGSVSIAFRSTSPPEPEGVAFVPPPSGEAPDLPDGVWDPRQRLADINRRNVRS